MVTMQEGRRKKFENQVEKAKKRLEDEEERSVMTTEGRHKPVMAARDGAAYFLGGRREAAPCFERNRYVDVSARRRSRKQIDTDEDVSARRPSRKPHPKQAKAKSAAYLKQSQGRRRTTADLQAFAEQSRVKRLQRKQLIDEVETRDLTFAPTLNKKSMRMTAKARAEG